MPYGKEVPFAARRLYAAGDLDEELDRQATDYTQPVAEVLEVAPTQVDTSRELARTALQRAFMQQSHTL